MKYLQNEIELDREIGLRILNGYSDRIAYDTTNNSGSIELGLSESAPGHTRNNEYYIIQSALKAVGMEIEVIGGGKIQFSASKELLKQKDSPDFGKRIRAPLPASIGR